MFTPILSLLGADLLHLATSQHLELTGRPLGISGILSGSVLGDHDVWRWTFIAGLVGSAVIGSLAGSPVAAIGWGAHQYGKADGLTGGSVSRRVLAGVLVGFGSRLGSGCTSGHFLCGMSRLSPRSIVASVTFFLTATLISNVFPHPAFQTGLPFSNTIDIDWPKVEGSFAPTLVIPVAFRLFYQLVLAKVLRQIKKAHGPRTAEIVLSFVSGLTFGTGLLMSGMVSPLKTLGFMRLPFLSALDRTTGATSRGWSQWDPSLAMVIVAAVLPNMRHWLTRIKPSIEKSIEPALFVEEKGKPATVTAVPARSRWQVPLGQAAYNIDAKLIIGSIVFGLGWGLGGVCPGPALGRLGLDGWARAEGWTFIASVLFGMKLAGTV